MKPDYSGLFLGLCLNRACAVNHGLLIEDAGRAVAFLSVL